MEKIYFGICDYEEEPAVLLAVAEDWDRTKGIETGNLSKEVCSMMCSIGVEWIEETLYGYFDGTEEDLKNKISNLGFTYNEEVESEAKSILE